MFLRFLVAALVAYIWLCNSAFAQTENTRRDRILVKFKAGEAPAGDERPFGKVLRRFPALNIEVIQLDGTKSVEDALAAYKVDARVVYAQPDHIRTKEVAPNDPGTSEADPWHQENDGRDLGKLHADISARAAWDIRHDATDVVVAVLDTGIRFTHEDLAANMWTNDAEANGQPGVDDDGDGIVDDIYGANLITNTGVPMDDEGHGTFVAGLIGAVGDNGKGVTGICWRVKLMAVKVLDGSGSGSDSDIIAGLEYARQHGAKIINASLGRTAGVNLAMGDAISALAHDGVILVAAAGNNSANNDFDPAISTYPATLGLWNVVTVAATTRNDLLATFSNFGWRSVDLGAPGVQVPSTSSESDTSYDVESGTSMSAPIVAGALALVTAQTPDLTPIQRIERLLNSVDPLSSLAGKCLSGGRLNLARALEGGSIAPLNDSFTKATPLGSDVRFAGTGVTAAASVETGEYVHPGLDNTRKSLWFSWTAPYTGLVKFITSWTLGSVGQSPVVVSVYEGETLSEIRQVGSNTNAAFVSGEPFFVQAQAGHKYSISLQNAPHHAGGASGFFGIYNLAPDGFGDYGVLSVDSYGPGTVTPAKLLGETIQRRDKRVTLKATPAKGYILYAWVDPTVDDIEEGILSRNPVFTVDLSKNALTAVRAVFANNPFRDLKGHYNGLANLSGGSAGFLILDLSESGAFTASIKIGKGTYRLKGTLRSDRKFDVTIKRPGSSPLVVHLKLNSERRITGTIGSAEGEYQILAEAGGFSYIDNPALSAGSYTVQLPISETGIGKPGGTGYGLLYVSESGNARFNGYLGDGRRVSLGTTLYRTGHWPFFAAPYPKGGSVAGLMAFDDTNAASDWSGDLVWTKPANLRDTTYPFGFSNVSLKLIASRYLIPSGSTTVIDVPSGSGNLQLSLEGAGLPPTEFTASLNPQNAVAPLSDLNMIIFTSTGEFAANFRVEGQIRSFHGMFLQKQNRGEGYFIRGEETGKVTVFPSN